MDFEIQRKSPREGRVGEWESGRVGEWESGGGSEGSSGRGFEWEIRRIGKIFLLPSSFFLLPSSFFLLPSSFFLQKLTLESGGSNCRI
jgi:hypothetical protein